LAALVPEVDAADADVAALLTLASIASACVGVTAEPL